MQMLTGAPCMQMVPLHEAVGLALTATHLSDDEGTLMPFVFAAELATLARGRHSAGDRTSLPAFPHARIGDDFRSNLVLQNGRRCAPSLRRPACMHAAPRARPLLWPSSTLGTLHACVGGCPGAAPAPARAAASARFICRIRVKQRGAEARSSRILRMRMAARQRGGTGRVLPTAGPATCMHACRGARRERGLADRARLRGTGRTGARQCRAWARAGRGG
jgi:hypothetical protein